MVRMEITSRTKLVLFMEAFSLWFFDVLFLVEVGESRSLYFFVVKVCLLVKKEKREHKES